jgi:hypothetical protein
MAAGERGAVVRREVKWGALECSEAFTPLLRRQEDPRGGVYLGHAQGLAIEPRVVYRQEGWEPILPGPVSGPSQWFPIFPDASPVQTRTKSVEYPAGCDTRYWALPMVNQQPPISINVALSQKTETQPIPEAPAELQSTIQGVLKAHAPAEFRQLAKELVSGTGDTRGEDPTALWRESKPPRDGRARCLPLTESEWLCHATQDRELRARKDPDTPRVMSQSRFWLRGSTTAMRIIQASREYVSDTSSDMPLSRVEAEGALMLEGRAWWLLSVRGGFLDGHELWGPRGDSMERVSGLFPHPQTCD